MTRIGSQAMEFNGSESSPDRIIEGIFYQAFLFDNLTLFLYPIKGKHCKYKTRKGNISPLTVTRKFDKL